MYPCKAEAEPHDSERKRANEEEVYGGHLSKVRKGCVCEKISLLDEWSGPYVDDCAIYQLLSPFREPISFLWIISKIPFFISPLRGGLLCPNQYDIRNYTHTLLGVEGWTFFFLLLSL